MKTKLYQFFTGIQGEFSFKRLQTGLFTFLFTILFFVNLFSGKMVHDSILDALVFLVAFSYTGIAVEKFAKKQSPAPEEPENIDKN